MEWFLGMFHLKVWGEEGTEYFLRWGGGVEFWIVLPHAIRYDFWQEGGSNFVLSSVHTPPTHFSSSSSSVLSASLIG